MAARKKPVNAAYVEKEPSETHVAFSGYIQQTTGVEIDAEVVGLVQRLYPLFLKSPAVAQAREAAKAAREAEARIRAEEKRAKLQAKLDRLNEQRAKVYEELGLDVPDFDGEEPEPEVVSLPAKKKSEPVVVDDPDDDDPDLDDWGDEDDEDDEEEF